MNTTQQAEPPHNIEAEQQLLGAILGDSGRMKKAPGLGPRA